jgi:hypothetical protein
MKLNSSTAVPRSSGVTAMTGHSVDGVLQRMSVTYDPVNSSFKGKAKPFENSTKPCHSLVINTAKKRGQTTDKIWFFGGKPDTVMHSVLTDKNNKPVADSFAKSGRFSTKEYTRFDLNPDGSEKYDYLDVIDLQDFLDDYMDYESEQTAALSVDAAVKDISSYSIFSLRNPLELERRGKVVKFKRGDKLGWRFSSNGKFFRLVSPFDKESIVYSIPVSDESLKWLVKHDPKAQKRRVF